MKKVIVLAAFAFTTLFLQAQQPGIDLFKQAFEKSMQKLKPAEVTRRTIKYVQVTPGKNNGGYYPFTVTAFVHDYSPGYPRNRYYGQSCVGKMDNWKFDLVNIDGEWTVQGRLTITSENKKCADNTAEGVEAIPVASVEGSIYQGGNTPVAGPVKQAATLYIGQYAGYGSGGHLLMGMGFNLLANGTYYDLDRKNAGTYIYNAQQATISFKGGFLAGQTGTHVKSTGFDIGNIHCEPWR